VTDFDEVRVTLILNDVRCDFDLEPRRTLGDALNAFCGTSSVELGCADGTCGACTVLVDGEATRSCLMLAVQCDGAHVRTVEGLAAGHPLQAALSADDTAQCCSSLPGLVMLAAGAMDQDPGLADDPERLRKLLSSNVSRCTDHAGTQRAVIRLARRGRTAD
jgi:carbon-monoxide dehydrogenase small subunit